MTCIKSRGYSIQSNNNRREISIPPAQLLNAQEHILRATCPIINSHSSQNLLSRIQAEVSGRYLCIAFFARPRKNSLRIHRIKCSETDLVRFANVECETQRDRISAVRRESSLILVSATSGFRYRGPGLAVMS